MAETQSVRSWYSGMATTGGAQCLEYDIFAQGADIKTVQSRFLDTLRADLSESVRRNGEQFKGIPAAPQWAVDLWDNQQDPFVHRGVITLEDDRKSVPFELALCA